LVVLAVLAVLADNSLPFVNSVLYVFFPRKMQREECMDESYLLTQLIRKLNAPNLNPQEQERLEAQIEQLMGLKSDPFESDDDAYMLSSFMPRTCYSNV
jgi:hypothetical protein